tara:strand:- start:1495 stop:2637 length:1143 start_codon:yes stop_codon:yes gene_type:complete
MAKFDILADFSKSKGSFLHDAKSGKNYLDLFNMFSSVPIGYGHGIFGDRFKKEILDNATVKFSKESFENYSFEAFDKEFKDFALQDYAHRHYTNTGALGVEAAIKLIYKKCGFKNIAVIKNSFHGIYGRADSLTTRFKGINKRLDFLPEQENIFSISNLDDLKKIQKLGFGKTRDICAVIVEPIQCTFGDKYLESNFINELFVYCRSKNIKVIFDEVQTGFCASGKVWYYKNFEFVPDILVFGKKAQVSGVAFNDFFYENDRTLSCTWDGDVNDAIRCKYIIEAIKKYNLLENIKEKGLSILNFLKSLGLEARGIGGIICVDLPTSETRNNLCDELFSSQVLVNATGDKSIRLRPNISISQKEVDIFKEKFEHCLSSAII